MNHWLWAYQNRQRDVGVPIDSFLVCCWFCIAFLEKESPSTVSFTIGALSRQRAQTSQNNSAVKLSDTREKVSGMFNFALEQEKKQLLVQGLFISKELLYGHVASFLAFLLAFWLTPLNETKQSHYLLHAQFWSQGNQRCRLFNLASFIHKFCTTRYFALKSVICSNLLWLGLIEFTHFWDMSFGPCHLPY